MDLDKRGEQIRVENLIRILGNHEESLQEARKILSEFEKEDVIQYPFYLVNSSVSLTGVCMKDSIGLYASGEVGVYGLERYCCKSGTTRLSGKTGKKKPVNLAEIAKSNSVGILKAISRRISAGDLYFFAKRALCNEEKIVSAIKNIQKAQNEANKYLSGQGNK